MPSSNVAPKWDLNVTLRGDVGVISAISDVELLEQEVVRFARLSKGWSHSSYYRQGDQVFVHAGKLPQVIDHLIRQGHWIEPGMSANWPQRSHVVPPNDEQGLTPCEVDLLHSLGDKPWGQIIASRGLIPRMISAITKFFSRANVLVVARNTQAGNRIARELEQGTNRQISTGQIIPWNKQPLVHIDSLAGLCRSNQDWQVLIFADAESARSATGMQQAASMPESLIIAMLPADQQLDWEDQLRIRVTCGPVVYRLSSDPGAGTAVSVLTVRAYRSRRQVSRNGLIRKRCHLWHNEKRNQQIATIAESFADGN